MFKVTIIQCTYAITRPNTVVFFVIFFFYNHSLRLLFLERLYFLSVNDVLIICLITGIFIATICLSVHDWSAW